MRLSFTDNGPILLDVAGPCTVERDGKVEHVERLTVALCRCWHSETKPYCDGTHRRAGFLAPPSELRIHIKP